MKYEGTALFTDDIKASADFYREVIGLEVMMDNGSHIAFLTGLYIWDRGSAEGLIFNGAQDKRAGHSMELCFSSENVSADYDRIKASGAKILNPLAEQPWSQLVFRIMDPDGNIVEIAESIFDTFRRLKESGLSLEEISGKTFTSVEDLKKIFG